MNTFDVEAYEAAKQMLHDSGNVDIDRPFILTETMTHYVSVGLHKGHYYKYVTGFCYDGNECVASVTVCAWVLDESVFDAPAALVEMLEAEEDIQSQPN